MSNHHLNHPMTYSPSAEATRGTLDGWLRKAHITLILLVVAGVLGALGPLILDVKTRLIFGWSFLEWFLNDVISTQFGFSVVLMLVIWQVILGGCAACILAERKISAYMQDRDGPNRVGYLGVLQPIADGLKFLLKEDVIPKNVDKPLYILAPAVSLITALLGFLVIPWTGNIRWPWMAEGTFVTGQIVSLDIGFIYLIAIASLGVYGVVLAGYASNNKYAFYGGMRATAQMISYEVPLGLSLLVVLLIIGSLRMEEIVAFQMSYGWLIFYQPLAFLMLLIAAFAETNRLPFDLAECEQELVGGFHTEYSAMKFSLFFLGEYSHMITNSALLAALFLGGHQLLPIPGMQVGTDNWILGLLGLGVFAGKVALFIAFYMIIRWTIPRFRYDQLMRLCWQGLIPIGIGLVTGTGILLLLNLEGSLIANLLMNVVVLAVVLAMMARSKARVTGRQEDLPDVPVVDPMANPTLAGGRPAATPAAP